MHEYGHIPIPRPRPRYDGERHHDESPDTATGPDVHKIAELLAEHKVLHEWYDPVRCVTQYHCGCKMWFYDHDAHVAQEIMKVVMVKPTVWVRPEGCVCGGPSDPYHSWCNACTEQAKRGTE